MNITGITARDIRFPTSRNLDGSDAMNPDPDYSAAYVTLHTDLPDREGNGLTFTIGRGNELCVAAIQSLAPLLAGLQRHHEGGIIGHFRVPAWFAMVGTGGGSAHLNTTRRKRHEDHRRSHAAL